MFVDPTPRPPLIDEELASETPSFTDRLVYTFELSSALAPLPIVINGHNIVRLSLDLKSSGFVGEITFKIDDDTAMQGTEIDLLITMFRTPALLKIRLGMKPEHMEEDSTAVALPFEVHGLISEKAMIERAAQHAEGGPLSYRLYRVRFADPAQVLWRQHYPLVLYTQQSLLGVILANCNSYVSVSNLDPTLITIMPLIFLGLDAKNRAGERASFYDFVMWQLDETQRIWHYNYSTQAYEIHKIKLPPLPVQIFADDIKEIITNYPAPPRNQKSLLNDYTEFTQNLPVVSTDPLLVTNVVTGVRQDVLWNTPLQTSFEAEYLRQGDIYTLPKPEFILRYRMFPSFPYAPGVGITFTPLLLDFKSQCIIVPLEAQSEPCRVFRVVIATQSRETDVRPTYDGRVPVYCDCRVNVWLEPVSSTVRRGPPYILPKYPVHIEGKILSEVGLPTDETYQFYPDLLTSISYYKVTIPLWNNQIVTLPYNPNMDPGHFYFPAYKDERILCSFYYDKAFLKRFLDWRPMAQLPLESQGDHLLMGKTPVNRTSLRHTYSSEQPVFAIERWNELATIDYELMKLAEGNCLLQVGTPLNVPPTPLVAASPLSPLSAATDTAPASTLTSVPTSVPTIGAAGQPLFCKLLMDKQQGIVLEIMDSLGTSRQTVTMDGTTLKLQVSGTAATSTFTQTADEISLVATGVSITAETVKIRSALGTTLDSLASTSVTSMTGISLKTPMSISQTAIVGVNVSTLNLTIQTGESVEVTAAGGIELTGVGAGVEITGTTVLVTGVDTTVSGTSLSLLGAATIMDVASGIEIPPAPEMTGLVTKLLPLDLLALTELPAEIAGIAAQPVQPGVDSSVPQIGTT